MGTVNYAVFQQGSSSLLDIYFQRSVSNCLLSRILQVLLYMQIDQDKTGNFLQHMQLVLQNLLDNSVLQGTEWHLEKKLQLDSSTLPGRD